VGQICVAAYCRVSTDKDEQHLSYEAQKEFYTDKILKNPEWKLAGIFADRGISGTMATKRPDFMRMIRQCKAGKIQLILTKSVTRFARNTVDALEYARMLKEMGIGIIFEKEGLDTRNMTSEFMLTIYASLAQAESESISGNVKWGRQKSFAKGNVHISYRSTLGYRRGADGNAEIDPEQAVTVRRIYDEFLAGRSMKGIAENLTADGLLTAMGKAEWSPQAVKQILQSEKYAGNAILGKTYVYDCISHKTKKNNGEQPMYFVEGSHPAIIEPKMWNRTQEELARRTGKRRVKQKGTTTEQGKYSSKYALTELLVCGKCGTPYRRCTWSKHGRKKIVWRCISRLDYGKKYCADSPTIEESALQKAILDAIHELADDGGVDSSSVSEVLKRQIGIELCGGNACGTSANDTASDDNPYILQARMAELDRSIADLIVLETADGNQGKYDEQFEKLCAEKAELKAKIEQRKSAAANGAEQARLNDIFNIIDGLKNTPPTWNEQIIRQMLDYVKVLSKDRILIKFKSGGEAEKELV